ncbi:predicted protein [Chaetomium globosum CBS 148.51]|uniref:Uncharacterized protein n=1 Tax=Chaetomium globosum (strain ATCC 6205 / CBS 148.51 / DSM 1962 / NBRC 6347 / NRRL 1970) TaxID=306901 RepID=Q2HES6_CHAGB|nr:uncharacterized protein CHGG_01278 [Chaetomium globosum CBS 148.51]EAQ93043.1 predicted protein [Chaetomium globosum CBS 148.51]
MGVMSKPIHSGCATYMSSQQPLIRGNAWPVAREFARHTVKTDTAPVNWKPQFTLIGGLVGGVDIPVVWVVPRRMGPFLARSVIEG